MHSSQWVIAVCAATALSACGQPRAPAEKAIPPGVSRETPSLWSAQTLDGQGKVTRTALICADAVVHRGFSSPLPAPDGQACKLTSPPVEQAGRFAARCMSGPAHLRIQADRTGDLQKDFTVKLLIQSDVKGYDGLVQTLRYRRLGDCPSGWAAGDSAAPGGGEARNSITGATRKLDVPAPSIPN